MEEKFRKKYRRKSRRLQGFDYSADGAYFVTICTKNRENFFREIQNGIMGLNELGLVAHQCWENIPDHFPFVVLDEFVVMPNHVHGILFINNAFIRSDAINRVATEFRIQKQIRPTIKKFGIHYSRLQNRGHKICTRTWCRILLATPISRSNYSK